MKAVSTLNLYLHTHWDREWYLPYESYRAQLVGVVRDILAKLKAGELPNFLLDGQSCALEDVVEVDPTLSASICALMKEGKLSCGPWYVLADQFLVSGESLVRNLKIGLDTTRQFGDPAMVGYCPDTFGHTGDLPRILRGFGIDSAVVWRGVPLIEGLPAFRWQSQDGSTVLAHHLPLGYYQTAFHQQSTVDQLLQHLERFLKGGEGTLPLLVPVGGDHLTAPAGLIARLDEIRSVLAARSSAGSMAGTECGATVPAATVPAKKMTAGAAAASSSGASPTTSAGVFKITTEPLTEFCRQWQELVALKTPLLATVSGELRDNAAALRYERAYTLQGVLSTRLYLKRENRLAEHRLIHMSEPTYTMLALLFSLEYPQAQLLYAWKLLLKNHPHDSICGCSIDAVHREMLQRWAKLRHTLNALDGISLENLCNFGQAQSAGGADPIEPPRISLGPVPVASPDYAADSVMVGNVSAHPISGPVMVVWARSSVPAPGEGAGTNGGNRSQPATKLSQQWQIISKERQPLIFSGLGREPDVRAVDLCKAWVWAADVPATGLKLLPFSPDGCDQKLAGSAGSDAKMPPPVAVEGRKVSNGLLAVEVEENGDLLVTASDKGGLSRVYRIAHNIVDTGDGGDTYNFDPLPDDEPLCARVSAVKPWLKGPLVGSIIVSYEIGIPSAATEYGEDDADPELKHLARASRDIPHNIAVEISLRRGVPIVFFSSRWLNKSTDHRLEIVFDTGLMVEQTFSESHFAVVRRAHNPSLTQLPVAKGCEAPSDRFPCQRFFIANGQIFLNQGMPEYGANGTCVSMTMLRAVSRLSRPRLMTRGGGAGPGVATPEANCNGLNEVVYGWAPLTQHNDDNQLAESYRLAELFEGSLWAVPVKASIMPQVSSLFSLDNQSIRLVSLYMNGDRAFFRLLNVSRQSQRTRLTVQLPSVCLWQCDLDERLAGERLQPVVSQNDGASVFDLTFSGAQLMTLSLCVAGR